MIGRDALLILFGAAITLVGGVILALTKHGLSLRADRIKRERDREQREAEERRRALTEGVRAYCFKCKQMRDIKDPVNVVLKNGRPAVKGVCAVCGTKVVRMGKGTKVVRMGKGT